MLLVLAFSTMGAMAHAVDPINTGWFGNTAIKGYDPVAYFTKGEPVKGGKAFTVEWRGANWLFANEANKELFEANPEKYAPQYGGYCAYAVSQGATASIDPEAWTIHEGKLYLNYSKAVQRDWLEDREGYIRLADEAWPKLLED